MESATSSAAEAAPPLAADTVDLAGELIDARFFRLLRLVGRNQRPASELGRADAEPTGGTSGVSPTCTSICWALVHLCLSAHGPGSATHSASSPLRSRREHHRSQSPPKRSERAAAAGGEDGAEGEG